MNTAGTVMIIGGSSGIGLGIAHRAVAFLISDDFVTGTVLHAEDAQELV